MNKHRFLAVGLLSALLLSACGGDEATNGDGDDAVAGELNIAYNAQPPTMDPITTTAHATRIFARLIFEPLVDLDAEGEVQPVLAEDFETSDDGLTLTFHLRDDVTFHDGSALEAADVLASLERWVDLSIVGSTYFGDAEIDSPEEGVVTLTLPQPMYLAPELLADPGQMPHIMPEEVVAEADEEGLPEHIGTGPYTFGDWETDQYLRLDRFADYASPQGEASGMAGEKTAHFEEMYFRFVGDDSTRQAGLQTGEYDLGIPIPWDNIPAVDEDPNVNVSPGESGLGFALFNKAEGPMADQDMRRAVIAAMDTESILLSAYGDEEYFGNNSALMPEDSPWHVPADPEFEDFHQNQDLDAAASYMDDADYDGELIRLVASPEYEDHYDAAVVLQQQLEEAGMNTELITSDWATVLDTMDDPSGFEIAFSALSNWPVVPATMYFFSPDTQGTTESEEIFAATEAMTTAVDEEEAQAAMEQLQEAYADYLPVIKIGDRRTASGLSADLEGYDYITSVGEIFHHVRPAE